MLTFEHKFLINGCEHEQIFCEMIVRELSNELEKNRKRRTLNKFLLKLHVTSIRLDRMHC